jgi:hypothetical protein
MWLMAAVARTMEPPSFVIAGTLACGSWHIPSTDYKEQGMVRQIITQSAGAHLQNIEGCLHVGAHGVLVFILHDSGHGHVRPQNLDTGLFAWTNHGPVPTSDVMCAGFMMLASPMQLAMPCTQSYWSRTCFMTFSTCGSNNVYFKGRIAAQTGFVNQMESMWPVPD